MLYLILKNVNIFQILCIKKENMIINSYMDVESVMNVSEILIAILRCKKKVYLKERSMSIT